MTNKPLFKRAFLLLIIVGFLNFVATIFYLYWSVWWFDNLLHFLSGACIAIACLSFFHLKSGEVWRIVFIGVFFALLIGIVWEIFEWYFEIVYVEEGLAYVFDTTSDILMDTTGALLASLYARRILLKNE
jgi:uncharacterized membrane protein YjdF